MKTLSRNTKLTAAGLILVDLLFVLLHFVHKITGFSDDRRFKITTDRGIAEFYQYLKFASIAILLVWLYARRRRTAYAFLSCVFCYLLLDDAFQIHELLGRALADGLAVSAPLGLRGQDLGELLVSTSVGFVLLGLLAAAYLSNPAREKEVCRNAVTLLVLLAFFGVLIDMLHIMIGDSPFVSSSLGALEDGGEMIVASVMTAYFYSVAREPDANEGALAPGVE